MDQKNTKDKTSDNKFFYGTVALAVCLTVIVIALACTIAHLKSRDAIKDTLSDEHHDHIKSMEFEPRKSDSQLGNYSKFAVAADNGVCSSVGREILLKGGNAVDAAIAVDLCIGVVNPQSSGIGGGFFMTIYNATTKVCSIIDAREMAPGKATENMFEKDPEAAKNGYLAIAVPGEIHGLYTAYKMFGGSVPWKQLVEPTIKLCREGYPVSGALAKAIEAEKSYIMNEPNLRSILVNNNTGLPLVAGEIIKQPRLAATLEKLAHSPDPIEEFYHGEIAKTIVKDVTGGGGIITIDDMKRYGAKVREPMILRLSNGLNVCGPPPPASAAVTMAILNIIDGYNMTKKNLETFEDSVTTFHRIIEAQKFAYAMRSYLGDSDFVDDALKIAKELISGTWAESVRAKITDSAHPTGYYGGQYQPLNDHGTTHMNVLDKEGSAVSVTSTVNRYFGSKKRSAELGIIYNDHMDDFSLPHVSNTYGYLPSVSNFIRPYKRPQSSISPLVIYDDKSGVVRLVVGASGGSTIISGTAYVAAHNLFFGANIKQAIDYPRIHNQLYPNVTRIEKEFSPAIVEALEKLGQNFKIEDLVGSMSSAIEHQGNTILANSEYRTAGGFPSGLRK